MFYQPRPAQALGTQFLLEQKEALLVAGCGLGKTAMVYAALDELFLAGDIHKVLILAPHNVANTVWPEEAEQWEQFAYMEPQLLHGRRDWEPGKHLVHTLNYESLVKMDAWTQGKNPFDVVVYDESTFMANARSKRFLKMFKWLMQAKRRWGLTGAATPNNLMQIFGQMKSIDGGDALGKFVTNFQRRYFHPVDPNRHIWLPNENAEDQIYKLIGKKALRLSRADWLGDVPEIVEQDVMVKIPAKAAKEMKQFHRDYMLDDQLIAANPGVRLAKLRQMASGQCYENHIDINAPRVVRSFHDAKIQALNKIKKKHKTLLVMTEFQHELERVVEHCGALRFHRDHIADWNKGKIPLMVANPASMAHGLNLQFGGNAIVWYCVPENRDHYDQANMRLSRPGQGQIVFAIRLIGEKTVDELTIQKLRNKHLTQEKFLTLMQRYE